MSRKSDNCCRKGIQEKGPLIQCSIQITRSDSCGLYSKTCVEVKPRIIKHKVKPKAEIQKPLPVIVLYKDILELWLQSSKIHVKESTYARYRNLIDTHISPFLGSYPISNLSTQLIENYINFQLSNGRLEDGSQLSAKTVSDILAVIKSTIDYAQFNNYSVHCNLSKVLIKRQDREMQILSKSDQEALIALLTTDMDEYKFGVLLSLYTGIRIGELCALQWKDFDFEESILRIRKTLQRIQNTDLAAQPKTKIIITEPKSHSSIRTIPLHSFIKNIAEKFAAAPDAYVLSGNENHFVEPRTMQNHFKSYIRKCSIEMVPFHSLRHTFATNCVEAGFEIKSLSEILGHSSVNITLNRYVHSSLDMKHINISKLSAPKLTPTVKI